MSKTQEKRALRKAEQIAFIRERRIMQLMLFQQAFDTGVRLFEDNKEKLSAEEVEVIQAEMERNRALIDKLQEEIKELEGEPDGKVVSNPQT